jgi:hypothetical protein
MFYERFYGFYGDLQFDYVKILCVLLFILFYFIFYWNIRFVFGCVVIIVKLVNLFIMLYYWLLISFEELGKIIMFACLTKTSFLVSFFKYGLHTDFVLKGRGILTVQR